MIKYNVRSRQLVDIVGDIKRGKIILSPYFQRNLVWRQVHKVDFVKTILLGFPFPQIFLAKGGIDINDMSTTSMLVDGQQRMNSIIEYINDEYRVDSKLFSELTPKEKEEFLKYEIAIIELDLEADDPKIIEVFKRLNRTFYSLSTIEKLATEYAASELMLLAKLLTKEIDVHVTQKQSINPNVPSSFIKWAKNQDVSFFNKLIIETSIFSKYEISRKVHLMAVLNIIGTSLNHFFNRNIKTRLLDEYAQDVLNKDNIVQDLNAAAKFYLSLRLPKDSYWYNKSNFFTLIVFFTNNLDFIQTQRPSIIKQKLVDFKEKLPSEYELAAKEGVNNKKERIIRDKYIKQLLM